MMQGNGSRARLFPQSPAAKNANDRTIGDDGSFISLGDEFAKYLIPSIAKMLTKGLISWLHRASTVQSLISIKSAGGKSKHHLPALAMALIPLDVVMVIGSAMVRLES
jgi:hypothetical protein